MQRKTKSIKSKSPLIGVLFMMLFILIIPALSLIKIEEDNTTSFSIKFDMTNEYNNESEIIIQENIPVDTSKDVIEVSKTENLILPDVITKEDYDNNNFYLVQNYKTNEIITLTPTEYIKGVVSAEMPISFHEEALKAQAITAHSYALRQIENSINNNTLNGAYLSNDPTKFQACYFLDERKELWGDKFEEYEQKLDNVVNEIITKIAVVDNIPIIGAFHSMSNGQTEDAIEVWGQAVSYLVSTESIGDKYSQSYEMDTILTSSEVKSALIKNYPKINLDNDINNWFKDIKLNDSGRISSILVGDIEMSGHELRTILSLRCASFDITIFEDNFTFTQTGYGHGVGLSQYGADYMARQGADFEEILKHYFYGVELVDIN